jgi:hypothetical protein
MKKGKSVVGFMCKCGGAARDEQSMGGQKRGGLMCKCGGAARDEQSMRGQKRGAHVHGRELSTVSDELLMKITDKEQWCAETCR